MDENRLNTAFLLANHMVWRRASKVPEYAGMGTTLTGAIVFQNRLSIGNVGDSRAYLLRDGDMQQLTEDDTWVGNLIRNGALTDVQAKDASDAARADTGHRLGAADRGAGPPLGNWPAVTWCCLPATAFMAWWKRRHWWRWRWGPVHSNSA